MLRSFHNWNKNKLCNMEHHSLLWDTCGTQQFQLTVHGWLLTLMATLYLHRQKQYAVAGNHLKWKCCCAEVLFVGCLAVGCQHQLPSLVCGVPWAAFFCSMPTPPAWGHCLALPNGRTNNSSLWILPSCNAEVCGGHWRMGIICAAKHLAAWVSYWDI